MSANLNFLTRAKELQREIVENRRYLHQHPELSFKEIETSRFATEKLKDLGFTLKSNIARTGLTGTIGSGTTTVAIRADMDALPIDEGGKQSFKSVNKGVMHACGHDAHVSCALAAAKILSEQIALPGTLKMIMQPAEEDVDHEGKSGAYRMIEEGVMEGVDAVIGLHMDASVPAGKVAIMAGPIMAAADVFKVVIKGKGGHGAYPEATIDSVVIAAQIVNALQTVVSRKLAALEPGVLTIGSIQSDSLRGNVISERVTLLGTIRSFTESTRKTLIDELKKTCQIASALGGEAHVEMELGYPATVNDKETSRIMAEAARDLIGAENVITIPAKTWAEDFSMLAQAAPGAFMFLGGEIPGDRRSHHSPDFDLDESGFYIGSAILAETAFRLMNAK